MTGAADRRGFLRDLIRGAAQAAKELQSTLRTSLEEALEQAEPDSYFPDIDAPRQETAPAEPAERLASLDELRSLCAELGLETWADEVVALARPSVRLTFGGGGGSRLGGLPEVPPGFDWPVWEEEELTCLCRLRLDELPASPLPSHGTLLVFYALSQAPSGLRPEDGGACRVVLLGDEAAVEPAERTTSLPELPVVPSLELTLPVEPPSSVADGPEVDAWTTLRERLAALQGVEVEDVAPDFHALHRLLGHPDSLDQGMEVDAQLVSHGIDLEGGAIDPDPQIEELEAGSTDWRLLLQLSSDDDLDVWLGYFGRLYVWIRDDDLRAGRLDAVRAFVR